MTNEELVLAIQAGREDLYPVLWNQVKRFVSMVAFNRYQVTGSLGGCEVDDLIQSGYFALLEAVRSFTPEKECSFLTVLGYRLKTAFSEACGIRTSKRDPMLHSMSLDAPIGDDPEGDTFGDYVQDERDQFEELHDQMYLDQLRETMDSSASKLDAAQMETIYRLFVKGETLEQISKEAMTTPEKVRRWERNAFTQLRKPSAGLLQFIEDNTQYFLRVGVEQYQRTGTSSVEKIVLKREQLAKTTAFG